ncbi:hypothetical protein [Engelhardtia mirabilis]
MAEGLVGIAGGDYLFTTDSYTNTNKLGSASFSGDKPALTLYTLTFAAAFPEITELYAAGNPAKAEGYTQGAIKGTIIHELMHVCLGVPKDDEGTDSTSCLHLAIDSSAAKLLCEAIGQVGGSALEGDPPHCLDGLTAAQQGQIEAMCKKIALLSEKWNEPANKEKAEDCIDNHDLAELLELNCDDDPSNDVDPAACQVS